MDTFKVERDVLKSERDIFKAERDTFKAERNEFKTERDNLLLEKCGLRRMDHGAQLFFRPTIPPVPTTPPVQLILPDPSPVLGDKSK
ncbi:hypothetical protein TNCV_4388801 [Trichonephila clavipes]|nr:hypothetical protein TNCV_4388801 [Trichonephila clavipes]